MTIAMETRIVVATTAINSSRSIGKARLRHVRAVCLAALLVSIGGMVGAVVYSQMISIETAMTNGILYPQTGYLDAAVAASEKQLALPMESCDSLVIIPPYSTLNDIGFSAPSLTHIQRRKIFSMSNTTNQTLCIGIVYNKLYSLEAVSTSIIVKHCVVIHNGVPLSIEYTEDGSAVLR